MHRGLLGVEVIFFFITLSQREIFISPEDINAYDVYIYIYIFMKLETLYALYALLLCYKCKTVVAPTML